MSISKRLPGLVAVIIAVLIAVAGVWALPQSHSAPSPVVPSASSVSGPTVLPHTGLKAALEAAGFRTKDGTMWTSHTTALYIVTTPDGTAIVHIYEGQGVLCSPLGEAGTVLSLPEALAAANAAVDDFMASSTESSAEYSCRPGGSAGDSDPINPLPSKDA